MSYPSSKKRRPPDETSNAQDTGSGPVGTMDDQMAEFPPRLRAMITSAQQATENARFYSLSEKDVLERRVRRILETQIDYEIMMKRFEIRAIKEEIEKGERMLNIMHHISVNGSLPPELEVMSPSVSAGSISGRNTPTTAKLAASRQLRPAKQKPSNGLVVRRDDDVLVKMCCPVCRRSDFLNLQGFINHCRIVHQVEFSGHAEAVRVCGVAVSEADASGSGQLEIPTVAAPAYSWDTISNQVENAAKPVRPTVKVRQERPAPPPPRPSIREHDEAIDFDGDGDAERNKYLLGRSRSVEHDVEGGRSNLESGYNTPDERVDGDTLVQRDSQIDGLANATQSRPPTGGKGRGKGKQPYRRVPGIVEREENDEDKEDDQESTQELLAEFPPDPGQLEKADVDKKILDGEPGTTANDATESTRQLEKSDVDTAKKASSPELNRWTAPKERSRTTSNPFSAFEPVESRFHIKRRLVIGNVCKWIPPDKREEDTDDFAFKWMVYVRGPPNDPDITSFVRKVRFFLHPDYQPYDVCDALDPPFHLTRLGYGEFPIRVQLHFYNPDINRPVELVHQLKFDQNNTGRQVLGSENVYDVELSRETVFVEPRGEAKKLVEEESSTAEGREPNTEDGVKPQDSNNDNTAKPESDDHQLRNYPADSSIEATAGTMTDSNYASNAAQPTLVNLLTYLKDFEKLLVEKVAMFPLVRDASSPSAIGRTKYSIAETSEAFLALPESRRAALEWLRARSIVLDLREQYRSWLQNMDERKVERKIRNLSLSGLDLLCLLSTRSVADWCRERGLTPGFSESNTVVAGSSSRPSKRSVVDIVKHWAKLRASRPKEKQKLVPARATIAGTGGVRTRSLRILRWLTGNDDGEWDGTMDLMGRRLHRSSENFVKGWWVVVQGGVVLYCKYCGCAHGLQRAQEASTDGKWLSDDWLQYDDEFQEIVKGCQWNPSIRTPSMRLSGRESQPIKVIKDRGHFRMSSLTNMSNLFDGESHRSSREGNDVDIDFDSGDKSVAVNSRVSHFTTWKSTRHPTMTPSDVEFVWTVVGKDPTRMSMGSEERSCEPDGPSYAADPRLFLKSAGWNPRLGADLNSWALVKEALPDWYWRRIVRDRWRELQLDGSVAPSEHFEGFANENEDKIAPRDAVGGLIFEVKSIFPVVEAG
ncbi:hypothetical protein BJ742DRAFT_805122 [Cladochytrium replicatum]|nr:hypothetical protein BJ742DRAFT_805122 [Cladochytrium replicatum]